MRPLGVVIDAPRFDPLPCIGQGEEPAGVKAFSSYPCVERFDEGIVRGRSWPGEVELHAVQVRPLVKQAPGELRAVVEAYGLRLTALDHETIEDLDDVEGAKVGSRNRCEALSRAAVDHGQKSERATVEQCVRH